MSSIKRPYLRGKQTQILRGQQSGNGSAKMISIVYYFFDQQINIEMSRFLIIIIINLNKNIESIHF